MVLLWVRGSHVAYFGLLRFLGTTPFRFPFLDTHAVLAAAQCRRLGIDVYRWNPCDALGRVHAYSPLWLTITPRFLGTADTARVGLLLDLAFIISLPILVRPHSLREAGLFALAVFSPVTLYALERANNDILIFLIILYAAAMDDASPLRRSCFYGLVLIAGLLKYYPLVLLVLIVRETRRGAILYGGVAASALLAFALLYPRQLPAALANVPSGSYFTDSFAAKNLPWAMAYSASRYLAWGVTAAVLVALLALGSLFLVRRNLDWLAAATIDWTSAEARYLAIGAILLPACFFTATNIDYRGIYLLFVISGLVALHRARPGGAAAKKLRRLIAATLFLTWEEFFRHRVGAAAAAIPIPWLHWRIEVLFWVCRELLWWWLIAALAALALACLRRSALVEGGIAAIRRLWPRPAMRPGL